MQASGVILAGGRSSRMKFNKAFAEIYGHQVIQIIIDKFTGQFAETIIISNEPELYEQFGLPIYPDIYPRMGPVAGIHSGLYNAKYETAFICGCDVPFISMQLVEFMINKLDDFDSVVPDIDSYLQPLTAVYSRRCLPILKDCLENNRVKLIRIFEEINPLVVGRSELERFGILEELLLNVNDPQVLKLANDIAGRYLE